MKVKGKGLILTEVLVVVELEGVLIGQTKIEGHVGQANLIDCARLAAAPGVVLRWLTLNLRLWLTLLKTKTRLLRII